jgi:hypothetical protein
MKLLLISDETIFLTQFEKKETCYQYGNIQIQFIHYKGISSLDSIRELLISERFHLVLSCTQAIFSGHFIQDSVLVNSVNNYLGLHLRMDENKFEEKDIQNPPVSLVNRSTSYFNVFLEIPKAVGITTAQNIIDLELARLDVISETNYYFAYFLHQAKCNYYILNYEREFPSNELLDILSKLD